MLLDHYQFHGGDYPLTASTRNALANSGVLAPHTGKAYSEAMILGVGGGLGAGYILWEFQKYSSGTLVLGFQHDWNYPIKFTSAICDRLAVKAVFKETGGKKTALRHLNETLEQGRPPLAWVDRDRLPHWFLPSDWDGCYGHAVSVLGLDSSRDKVWVDDRSSRAFTLSLKQMAQARAAIPSYKNRLLLFQDQGQANLKEAVSQGIRDCAERLTGKSTSFSLPAWRKWAKMLAPGKDSKTWPKVFQSRQGLAGTLVSVYQNIRFLSYSGGALRPLYADFLTEASAILDQPGLATLAADYRRLSHLWNDFAETALPDEVGSFAEVKTLLKEKFRLMRERDEAGASQEVCRRLNRLRREIDEHCPLSQAAVSDLFERLRTSLTRICESEESCADRLLNETL